MLRYFYLEVLFLLTGFTLYAQTVQVHTIESKTETHKPLVYLVDTFGRYSAREAYQKIMDSGNTVGDKFTLHANVYWITFKVENQLNVKTERLFEFYGWTNIKFHQYKNGTMADVSETGHLVPFRKRDFPSADRCIVNLQLQPKEKVVVLARLEKDPDFVWQPSNLDFKTISIGEFTKGDKIRRYIVAIHPCSHFLK